MKKLKWLSLTFIALLFGYSLTFAQTEIDEYGKIIADDESAHLDYFAAQLKIPGTFSGTVIIFKDKHENIGKFLRHFYGVKKYITHAFGVSPDKFQVIFGGENERHTEMWLNKSKDEIVKTENQVLDETLAGKITKKTLFDSECIECDPVVFIDEFIFREGLDHLAKVLQANPKTYASLVIAKEEFISATRKERTELTKQIYNRLINSNNIAKARIKIRFTSARSEIAAATFYVDVMSREMIRR